MNPIYKQLLSKIEEYESIVIFTHHFPDGDCYGSAHGLKRLIQDNYPQKKVFAIGEKMGKYELYMGKLDIVDDKTIESSLGIIVDHNSPDRAGDPREGSSKETIRFDHHLPGVPPFPYLALVEEDACSCSDLIFRFAKQVGWKVSKEAARCLYLGFKDDCKQYSASNAPAAMLSLIEEFRAEGLDIEELDLIVKSDSPEVANYRKKIIANIINDNGITYAFMKKEDYLSSGVSFEEAGALSDSLYQKDSYPVQLLFTESKDGLTIRCSARAKNDFDVASLCRVYGGGGHLSAAGVVFKVAEHSYLDVVEEAKKRIGK